MKSEIKTKKLHIGGMTCVNCQNKIERKLRNTAGVKKVEVSYNEGTAVVMYDADIISLHDISAVIQELEYSVLTKNEWQKQGISRIIGLFIIIVALYMFLERFGFLNMLAPSLLADEKMGYGMLFVIGLVTSVHCVAMCGGINLSQCIPRGNEARSGRLSSLMPALLYNLGRIISYTAIGFVVGALGSVIIFSSTMQGALKLIAGIFMIIMGVNMLGTFSWLRRLNPRVPQFFAQKIDKEKNQRKSPLTVGLLNGFVPCGPLQAMQIYALSTGNPFAGATSMFLFSVGTVPLVFGLGSVSSVMGKKSTSKVMTAGAVLIVVFGLSMLSQGWSLSGFSHSEFGTTPGSVIKTQSDFDNIIENEVQTIYSTLSGRGYPAITVQVGIPVKWIIDAPQGSINGCNNRFIISEYGIEHTFQVGENIIEFTPTKVGTFHYSCWMGMIRSSITVVEATAETES